MRQKNLEKKRKLNASNEANASGPTDVSTSSHNVDPGIGQHSKSYAEEQFAGYIFMCNTKTKPDCFTYRVFGLPASMLAVVEKIKPNTKLFLYDFEVKLLYGLYVADSIGKLALEPNAFQGRFPAQVKFSIAKDCLPLPVTAFKEALGYTGTKFKQDLSYEQVNKLVSLFRPITVRTPHQEPLSIHSATRDPHHDVLKHPILSDALQVPPLSLRPSHSQIALTRGGELASDPYVIYKRHFSAYSHPTYRPGDSDIQRHNRVRYGHIPTISPPRLQPLTSSPARRSSSFTAAQWVAMAAETQNSGDQTSNVNQSSISQPGLSHGKKIDDVAGYTDAGYSYEKWRYPGTHEAVSVPTEQLFPGHIQSKNDPAVPHTTHSESSEVTAVSTGMSSSQGSQPYSGYHANETPLGYSQVAIPEGSQPPYNGYHQMAPTVTEHQKVNDVHACETLSGSQPYSGYHQTAPTVTEHQKVNNVHAHETLSGSQPYSGYHQTTPTLSAHQEVNNANAYGMPSGYSQVAITEGSQAYSGYHQTAPTVSAHQEVNNTYAYGYSQAVNPEGSQPYYSGYYQTSTASAPQDVNHTHAYEMQLGYSQVAIPEGSAGYGYGNQGYAGYYQAPSLIGGQVTTYDYTAHAYQNLPGSASSSYVAQSQGVPGFPQPQPSGSGVVVDNAYSYYHQGYYNPYPMAPIPPHQDVNNVPAQVPEAHPT